MHTSDFEYELPSELIAREPARPRDSSRMMLLDRKTGHWTDSHFPELPEFLDPSDVLVINNTRVIRARIRGRLQRASGQALTTREVEVLFAARAGDNAWEVLCRPSKRIRSGDRIIFGNGELEGVFGGLRDHGLRLLEFGSAVPVENFLETHGHVPLPPY